MTAWPAEFPRAHNRDIPVAIHIALHGGTGVINTRTVKSFRPFGGKLAPPGATGNQNRVRPEEVSAVQLQCMWFIGFAGHDQPLHIHRCHDLRAEFEHLQHAARRQFRA